MKKYGKRIAAFALSLVVALGSVCYNPPKAEAVVVESAAAMAGAFTYLSATGFEFAGDGTAYGAMADAFQMMFTDLTEEYDAYVNEVSGYPDVTAPTLQETILSGMTLLENGFVKFSAAAANALGRFSAWLIDKLGLVDGYGTPVTTPVYSYGGGAFLPYCDVLSDCWNSHPYRVLARWTTNGAYNLYVSVVPFVWKSSGSSEGLYASGSYAYATYGWSSPVWKLTSSYSGTGFVLYTTNPLEIVWANHTIVDEAGSLSSYSGFSTAFSLSADYEAAPTVEEQYAMVVNPGLTFEDEQSYIDAVMNGVVAGTLAPAYTIESTTAGDVINPDVGTDTEDQANILSWLKHIVQEVKALPQTIAQAVATVFVPSAEYLAALPVTVTDTFDDRTGFLTYPVSVVHDFAGRLSAGAQDFVLKWPTVYEPYSKGQLMAAGQFNVSKYVRDNDFASDVYDIYQWVVKAYMTFLFLGLCRKKYNSVVGDRLGG